MTTTPRSAYCSRIRSDGYGNYSGCPKAATWEIESPAADMTYACDEHLGDLLRDIPSYSLHHLKEEAHGSSPAH